MFETYMRNTILLMMDDAVESGNTLMDVPRVLADEDFRNYKLSKCKSQQVKDFWQKEALKQAVNRASPTWCRISPPSSRRSSTMTTCGRSSASKRARSTCSKR